MCNKVKDKPLLFKKIGKMKAHTQYVHLESQWMDGWVQHVV